MSGPEQVDTIVRERPRVGEQRTRPGRVSQTKQRGDCDGGHVNHDDHAALVVRAQVPVAGRDHLAGEQRVQVPVVGLHRLLWGVHVRRDVVAHLRLPPCPDLVSRHQVRDREGRGRNGLQLRGDIPSEGQPGLHRRGRGRTRRRLRRLRRREVRDGPVGRRGACHIRTAGVGQQHRVGPEVQIIPGVNSVQPGVRAVHVVARVDEIHPRRRGGRDVDGATVRTIGARADRAVLGPRRVSIGGNDPGLVEPDERLAWRRVVLRGRVVGPRNSNPAPVADLGGRLRQLDAVLAQLSRKARHTGAHGAQAVHDPSIIAHCRTRGTCRPGKKGIGTAARAVGQHRGPVGARAVRARCRAGHVEGVGLVGLDAHDVAPAQDAPEAALAPPGAPGVLDRPVRHAGVHAPSDQGHGVRAPHDSAGAGRVDPPGVVLVFREQIQGDGERPVHDQRRLVPLAQRVAEAVHGCHTGTRVREPTGAVGGTCRCHAQDRIVHVVAHGGPAGEPRGD